MERATLTIQGMHCGSCVGHVTRVLEDLDGVNVEKVEVGLAEVVYDEAKIEPQAVANAIAEAGYEAKVAASRVGG
jgi:copper chaperone CopZ